MSEMIGFIGLGHLGLPLATNLLNAGYPLRVYNRTASKAEALVREGAHLANRPVDAVTGGGIVASIVWDDAALESIVMSDGFLEHLGPGGVHLSMSTVWRVRLLLVRQVLWKRSQDHQKPEQGNSSKHLTASVFRVYYRLNESGIERREG